MLKHIKRFFVAAVVVAVSCAASCDGAPPAPTTAPTALPDTTAETLGTIADFLPVEENNFLTYTGSDERFSGYDQATIYTNGDVYQNVLFTGSMIIVEVLEYRDGALTLVHSQTVPKGFENFTGERTRDRVILKEPLVLGATWAMEEDMTAEITAANVPITTPYGTFDTMEITITTNVQGQVTKRYYAKGVGRVREEQIQLSWESDRDGNRTSEIIGTPIYSELSAVTEGAKMIPMAVLLPKSDGFTLSRVTFPLATNSDIKNAFMDSLRTQLDAISDKTRINTLTFDEFNRPTFDFTPSLIDDLKDLPDEETVFNAFASNLAYFAFTDVVKITVGGERYLPTSVENTELDADGFVYALPLSEEAYE